MPFPQLTFEPDNPTVAVLIIPPTLLSPTPSLFILLVEYVTERDAADGSAASRVITTEAKSKFVPEELRVNVMEFFSA